MIHALLLALQLVAWEDVKPPVLHQGYWQSCKQGDGTYGERVLQHREIRKVKPSPHYKSGQANIPFYGGVSYENVLLWELHMGPRDEFALYDHEVDGEDHNHDTDNKLAPAYRIHAVNTLGGKRTWTVDSLHLWISITSAGGSRDACESFYIRIERVG